MSRNWDKAFRQHNTEKTLVRRMDKNNHSELWKTLPWKKFQQELFRLQRRVFKAIQAGDQRKARNLQKLIVKSQSAKYLAIRQVTQLNAGKRTAGIDGKASLNFQERLEIKERLDRDAKQWKHQKLRAIPILKKDGTTRMLKVPTIADRVWQCLVKYVLEPAHEAQFHERSYGFRTGRSAHDAQKSLFDHLNSKANGKDKRVLELDIEKCFDRINHSTLMHEVIAPQGIKLGIFRCLKAGIDLGFPDQGVPQGGCVSPLLANIALNGIEALHRSKNTDYRRADQCVRYADDMVFILKPEDDANGLVERIEQFLADRGMKVSQKKTKLTAATDGFVFLGWHFKVLADGRFKCVPSQDNYKAFKQNVKAIVNSSNYGAKEKAAKLEPIVRGWRQYHQYCDMNGAKFSLWFIQNRAWKVFNKEVKLDKDSTTTLIEKAFPKVPYHENKFVKVKGNKSPYDGDFVYWSERNSRLYGGITAKILKKQHHSCARCGMRLLSDEKIHLHHVDGNHHNWRQTNLQVLHESCHDYIHMSNSECRELYAAKVARTDLTERGGG
jgi:RNA-directed DNA polymerase